MLEKLLETLVRIAVALETIANKEPATTITEKHEHNNDGTAKKAAIKPEAKAEAKAEAAKKPEPKPETKKAETKKADSEELTFAQCHTAFIGMCVKLRDTYGKDKMREISFGILNDFTGGQPLTAASLPKESYLDLYRAVENTLSNLNVDTTEE